MRDLLTDSLFLSIVILVATVASAVGDIASATRRRRAAGARRARVAARREELRRKLWRRGEVCPGVASGIAVMLARAERAALAATAAEDVALRTVDAAEPGAKGNSDKPEEMADLAMAAEEQMRSLLADLRRRLTPAAGAELEAAQAAWLDYRDRHVLLCREIPARADDRWPVRHFVSEAVTAERLADLHDLRDIVSLAP